MEIDEASARRIEVMMSELVGLDGLQRATFLGIEAEMLGEGGVEAVARAAGVVSFPPKPTSYSLTGPKTTRLTEA